MQILSKFCLILASTTIAAVCANSPAQAQLKIRVDYYSTGADPSQPASVYKNEFKVDSSENSVDIFLQPAKCEFAGISVVLDEKVYPQGQYLQFKPDSYGRPFLVTRDQIEIPKGSYGLKNSLRLRKNTAMSYADRKRYMSIVADNAFNIGEPGQAIVLANSRSFEPFKVNLSNLSGYPKVYDLLYKPPCPAFIPDCLSRV